MGRRIRGGVVERQVLDLLREHLNVLLKITDYAVLGAIGFGLPRGDLLPQSHHLIAHLLDEILVLLSVCGKERLRHGVFDLPLD